MSLDQRTEGHVQLPMHTGPVRQLLNPEEAAVLSKDYTKHEATYRSLFDGMNQSLLGTQEFEQRQHEFPEPLLGLLGKLAVLLEQAKPEPTRMTLKQVIAIRSESAPHQDAVIPSHTFVVIVKDSLDATYGGKLISSTIAGVNRKNTQIIGGQHEHLCAGDALYINNTSRFTKRRPPHSTTNAKDCMRFVISYAVNRSYLT